MEMVMSTLSLIWSMMRQAFLRLRPGLGRVREDEKRGGLDIELLGPLHRLENLFIADVLMDHIAAHPLGAGLDAEGNVLHPGLAHQGQLVVGEDVDAQLGDEADAQLFADDQAAEILRAGAVVIERVVKEPQDLGSEPVAVPAYLRDRPLRRVAAHLPAPVGRRGTKVAVEGTAARGDDIGRPQGRVSHRPAEIIAFHGDQVLSREGQGIDVFDHGSGAGEVGTAVAANDDALDLGQFGNVTPGFLPGGDFQDGALSFSFHGQVDSRNMADHVQAGHGGMRSADNDGFFAERPS